MIQSQTRALDKFFSGSKVTEDDLVYQENENDNENFLNDEHEDVVRTTRK